MEAANTPKRTFLVIEDDRPTNDSLQRKLQKIGFETEGCFDGEQGLNKMNEKTYDGIMLDLMMPIKDGFAVLAKRSTTKNPTTPVYVLTSLGEEKCELARELGAKMTFIKSQMSAAEVIENIGKDMGL
ncbi:MAG: response regulator [Candidatus Peribacteraceae bacterium]|nr:response regulator [Candidatus Peribacteraceae bacterium]